MTDIPCGEKMINYLEKYQISRTELSPSQYSNLVKFICGDKVNSEKVVKYVREKSNNR